MSELNFKITEQEANLILQSLSMQAYRDVFQLIAKIQDQATLQINESKKIEEEFKLK